MMNDLNNYKYILTQKLTNKQFKLLSKFIQENYGIKMPEQKQIMLQSRLQKRLKALNIKTFDEYLEYVFNPSSGDEIINMIDVVSTNKTEFYRENDHFEILRNEIFPKLILEKKLKKLDVWSAGSSNGQELYTLAIELNEFKENKQYFDYNILGTDISTKVLKEGSLAIYPQEVINPIPINIKKKYFLKSKNPNKKVVRVVPELRKRATFRRLNLVDNHYDINKNFDLIFCRNTLIYFEREIQEKVILNLLQHLKPHGFLFLGHSESLAGMKLPLNQYKPTIYTKKS